MRECYRVEWGSKRQRAAIERVERLCGGVSVVTGTNGNIEVVSPTFFFVYASILDAAVPSGMHVHSREATSYLGLGPGVRCRMLDRS